MALDPRTPVIVGAGQVTTPPGPDPAPAERPEPLALMAAALRAAAEDCTGAPPGGGGAGDRLLARLDSLRVVSCLGWRVANPAHLVAQRLGVAPAQTVVTAIGGNTPVSLLHDSARAIAAGHLDVVAVVGAEAMYARRAARRRDEFLAWAADDPAAPAPEQFGTDTTPVTDLELARGLTVPVHVYPLFENALRIAAGWDLDEHRRRLGELGRRFSEVAAANPFAFLPRARTAAEITEPSADNRMVAFPYPKLCTANMTVDQGAGFLVCSVEAARAAGVPEDRWVFPLAGAEANDHWFVSQRPALHRSPAIAAAGKAALALAGVGTDDLAAVDLYSCFPCVVQMAAAELGLPLDDDARPLTLTGGLTFFGGPGNNYSSHGLCAAVEALRRRPGAAALVSGLGWYATKHAMAVVASRPPADEGRHGYAWRDAQDEVDAGPTCPVDEGATGAVTVETYTVVYDREGRPERGIVACRTAAQARAWGNVTDAEELAELTTGEGGGRRATLAAGGALHLH